MRDFTEREAAVLNRIQLDFPPTRRPFDAISRELSMKEKDVLSILSDLKERSIVRNISGIFNADRLGYSSSLVAFRVPETDIDDAALIVSGHPGVSHNYRREHVYNLWFTIASDSPEKMDAAVDFLSRKVRAVDHFILKTERLLKIGVHFAIGEGDNEAVNGPVASTGERIDFCPLSDEEREAVRLLQVDLPIEPDPFATLIEKEHASIDPDVLTGHCAAFRRRGILRRYSAVLRHRKAGYRANAMTVWRPHPAGDIDRITAPFISCPFVSHLYIRSALHGGWDYPLFAMIHARDDSLLDDAIRDLARQSGMNDYMVLRTMREYKKERIAYFSDKFDEWEREAGI